MLRFALIVICCTAVPACGPGDTGGAIVRFHAYAAGLSDASAGSEFDTSSGFHVTLTSARLHIGAVYMRLAATNPGSANSACVGDTTYGLQVPGPVDVDVLSAELQEFSVLGRATDDLDQSAEIWLTGGDINNVNDDTVLVDVTGHASGSGFDGDFRGSLTISTNRLIPVTNPAMPGANPICKQRIIAPIPVRVKPSVGGNLLLRVNPEPWFDNLDFSVLEPSDGDGSVLEIPDENSGPDPDAAAGRAFFLGVTGASGTTYDFSWLSP